jgi:hypothetical protein
MHVTCALRPHDPIVAPVLALSIAQAAVLRPGHRSGTDMCGSVDFWPGHVFQETGYDGATHGLQNIVTVFPMSEAIDGPERLWTVCIAQSM